MARRKSDPADWARSYDKSHAGRDLAGEDESVTAGAEDDTAAVPSTPGAAEVPEFAHTETRVSGRRAIAHFADSLAYAAIMVVLFGLAALLSDVLLAIALVLSWPGLVVYYVLTQRPSGRSPGKKLVGLRVVDAEKDTPSTGALVRRSIPLIFEYFLVIALFAILSSEERQRLGDRWAGTYVIDDPEATLEHTSGRARGGDLAFSCAVCGEAFDSGLSARTHVEETHPGRYPDASSGVLRA